MGNTPVRSLTEGMEKTETLCATTRVYYRNTRAGCSSEQRAGTPQKQKHGIQKTAYMHGLCIRQGRDVPVYDLDFLSEV